MSRRAAVLVVLLLILAPVAALLDLGSAYAASPLPRVECDEDWSDMTAEDGLAELYVRVKGLEAVGWRWQDAFIAVVAGECAQGGGVVDAMICNGYEGTNNPAGCGGGQ